MYAKGLRGEILKSAFWIFKSVVRLLLKISGSLLRISGGASYMHRGTAGRYSQISFLDSQIGSEVTFENFWLISENFWWGLVYAPRDCGQIFSNQPFR
jgi:hypothetical protein